MVVPASVPPSNLISGYKWESTILTESEYTQLPNPISEGSPTGTMSTDYSKLYSYNTGSKILSDLQVYALQGQVRSDHLPKQ